MIEQIILEEKSDVNDLVYVPEFNDLILKIRSLITEHNNKTQNLTAQGKLDASKVDNLKFQTIALIASALAELTGEDRISYSILKDKLLLQTAEDGFYLPNLDGSKVYLKYDDAGFDVAKLSTHFKSLIETTSSSSKWAGKTFAHLGDSIVEFAIHVNKLALLTGTSVLNYGVAGTRIASETSGDTTSMVARYEAMSTADLIFVSGGTNDWGGSGTAQFGSFSDRVVTTFYGALHLLCQGLLTKYPKKPIIFTTPLHRSDELNTDKTPKLNAVTSKSLKDYRNAIIEVCNYYSIPVLDAYAESGIDAVINTSNYFSDGLHPNTLGGYKFAAYLFKIIEGMYVEYYVNNK